MPQFKDLRPYSEKIMMMFEKSRRVKPKIKPKPEAKTVAESKIVPVKVERKRKGWGIIIAILAATIIIAILLTIMK